MQGAQRQTAQPARAWLGEKPMAFRVARSFSSSGGLGRCQMATLLWLAKIIHCGEPAWADKIIDGALTRNHGSHPYVRPVFVVLR